MYCVDASVDPRFDTFDFRPPEPFNLVCTLPGGLSSKIDTLSLASNAAALYKTAGSAVDELLLQLHLGQADERVVLVQNKMPKFVVDAFNLAHEYQSDIKYFGTTNFESAIECAYAIASFMIAQTRSGTSFALSSDETMACNAQPRISELTCVLNKLTSSGEQLVLREHDRMCAVNQVAGWLCAKRRLYCLHVHVHVTCYHMLACVLCALLSDSLALLHVWGGRGHKPIDKCITPLRRLLRTGPLVVLGHTGHTANILTKWLPANEFRKHRNKLCNVRAQKKVGKAKTA